MSAASTASVRTWVEWETKRVSHASWAVWKMSKAKRRAQGPMRCTRFSPPPSPRPPLSVKPNVGRVGGRPVTARIDVEQPDREVGERAAVDDHRRPPVLVLEP